MSTSILSIIHANLNIPVRQLTPEFIEDAKKKTEAILRRVGITTFIGGTDISANEYETGEVDPHFQIQSWILAPTHEVRKAETKLRAAFPRTDTTPRPIKIKMWDGNLAALGYALKNTFVRRVSYRREASKDGFKHACRNTRDRPLRVEQHIELLIALDRVGLHARLHLSECRVVRTVSGPMIRMISNRKGREQP
jgi:hypothetical protein